jgi:hypothetical protein
MINPYNPQWIQVDDACEDHLFHGMKVRMQDDDEIFVVCGVSGCDGEQDPDGGIKYTPTRVEIDWGENHPDWSPDYYSLGELEFLQHEVEQGKARYEARRIIRRATVTARMWTDGTYRYYGGSRYVYASMFPNPMVVRKYDAQGKFADIDIPF